jgi:hypothetical protein
MDGVDSLPAGHMPCVNEPLRRHVPRLYSGPTWPAYPQCLPKDLSRPQSPTQGASVAAGRVCKDARIDGSLRVSVGLEPLPLELGGSW